jgi:hypothetical protein
MHSAGRPSFPYFGVAQYDNSVELTKGLEFRQRTAIIMCEMAGPINFSAAWTECVSVIFFRMNTRFASPPKNLWK